MSRADHGRRRPRLDLSKLSIDPMDSLATLRGW
jgi:hypothetical protein